VPVKISNTKKKSMTTTIDLKSYQNQNWFRIVIFNFFTNNTLSSGHLQEKATMKGVDKQVESKLHAVLPNCTTQKYYCSKNVKGCGRENIWNK